MLVELHNVKKYFSAKGPSSRTAQKYVRAVDTVSFSIAAGENVSLVGESGCGKTTLGRLILNLIALDAGSIMFNGQKISGLSPRAMRPFRKNMQMVFQDPFNSLDPRFTVKNIIGEALIFEVALSRTQKEQRIREALKAVQLPDDIGGRFPHEFSGGERQRIAIARALVMNPKLLVLDEAVSSLDVLVQKQIVNLLLDLQRRFEVTYLFISHNLRIVKQLSARIAVMYSGKIVEIGPAREIFGNPLHPYTRQLLSAAVRYEVGQQPGCFSIADGARLIDRGGGHFVLE